MTDSNQKWSQWLLPFLAALAVPAVSVVLHELGHYLSHAAFGYEINHFAYSAVISGVPPDGVDPEFASGLSFAAGSTVSLLLVGLAFLYVKFITPHYLAFAFILFECIRGFVGFVSHLVNFGAGHTFGVGFGELSHISRALNGPGFIEILLSWVELGLPLAALLFAWKLMPDNRLRMSVILFGGLLGGIVLWMLVLGPLVLPYP